MTLLQALFGSSVFASTFRLATPLLFGSLGGCFTKKVGIFFIAYESLMLIAAFFAAWGSYLSGNAFVGMLLAIAAALVTGIIFGILVLVFKADSLIVSIALNYGAWAITTQLLVSVFDTRGSFFSTDIVNFKSVDIPFLSKLGDHPLNTIFNNDILLVYLSFVFMVIAYIVLYKTTFGMRMRSVGINETAALSAGIHTDRYKWYAILLLSIALGIAGSYLPLSGVSMFSESMTAGRGNVCIAAVMIGGGNPIWTWLVVLLFAYSSAIVLTLTTLGLPTQIIEAIPYMMVIAVLLINGLFQLKRRRISI